MSLLRNRPLAAASLLLIVVVFLSFFLDNSLLLVFFSVASALLLVLVSLSIRKGFGHIHVSMILLTLAVLCGTFRVSLYHISGACWEENVERTVSAELYVKEILFASSYGTELLVDVEALDGDRVQSRAVVRAESLLPFYVGDRFEGSFTVKSLEYDNYYERAAYYYLSEGAYVILLANESTLSFTQSGTNSFAARIADARTRLSYRITNACPGEEGRLLSALLLGTRSELSDATVRDFNRMGVSHLLALSGLHLTVLVGILDMLLRLLGRGKRTRMAIVLFCCLLYLILTGCQYSMIRAVIMLAFVYLAFLWRGERDAMTALCFSAAFMLTITPTAIFSTSFQMTMLATFGLLVLNEQRERICIRFSRKSKVKAISARALYGIVASLSITLFATFAILPVSWMAFGEISLLAPLSNLLLIVLAAPMLLCALLLLICPLAPLAAVLRLPAVFMIWLVEQFSGIDAMVSLRYPFLPFILIPSILLFVALLLVDLKRARILVVAPMLLFAIAFTASLIFFNAANSDSAQILYQRGDGGGESIVLREGNEVLLCDHSSGTLTQLRNGWRLAQEECYATELDVLMITHYHERYVASLTRFCESVRVKSLLLPVPINEKEIEIYQSICAWANTNAVDYRVYDYGAMISFGESTNLRVGTPLYEDRSVEPALSLSVYYGGRSWCYHSAALSEYERRADITHLCTCECVMIGGHGPVPHGSITIGHIPSRVIVCDGDHAEFVERVADVTYQYGVKFYSYLLE